MGGILGIIGEGTKDELGVMAARMAIRGPLQAVHSPASGVLLGYCARAASSTPAVGTAVGVCRIENAARLRDELSKHSGAAVPAEDADLLAAYAGAFGLDALARARGHFSVAFWDERKRAVVLVCDQSGFRVTHYTSLPGRIVFATDYKAFLTLPQFVAEPDVDALQFYAATRNFNLAQPNLRGVSRVTAGQLVLFRAGSCEKRTYWRPTVAVAQRTLAGHAQAVRNEFIDVVRRQFAGYDKIGATLSAGVDAPSVLATVRHVYPEVPIISFTAGHGEDDPEVVGARQVAEKFGTEHHTAILDVETIPVELPRLVWHMEDPGAREEALLKTIVLRAASRHVRVITGGWGSDVIFAGMPRHLMLRLSTVMPFGRTALRELYQFSQSSYPPESWMGRMLKDAVYRGKDYPTPAFLGASGPSRVHQPDTLTDALTRAVVAILDFGYHEPSGDIASLDFITPFMDPDFINVGFTVPERYMVGWGAQKLVFRRAMEGLVPNDILHRPKAIQRIRHDTQLSDVFDSMADRYLTREAVRARGFVEWSYVEGVRRRAAGAAYPTEQMYRLWTLIAIEIWAQLFVDARGTQPPA